jgi:small-conductance mechanosensitive channel
VVQLSQQAQQMQAHASDLLGQADKEVADLKQQVAGLQMQLKDKGADLAVRDYEAETKRLSAVGAIDPMSLQIIVREMVSDMLQTQLAPVLQGHADLEGSLQASMQPPPAPVPMNG